MHDVVNKEPEALARQAEIEAAAEAEVGGATSKNPADSAEAAEGAEPKKPHSGSEKKGWWHEWSQEKEAREDTDEHSAAA